MYLRQKNFKDAVETLKMFEKKETKVASTAATNLSFLYFLVSNFFVNIQSDILEVLPSHKDSP